MRENRQHPILSFFFCLIILSLLGACMTGWESLGYSKEDESAWESAGFGVNDYELADKWRTHGFDPEESRKWTNAGFSPDDAVLWHNEGFTPKEATLWEKEGGFSAGLVSAAYSWKKAGFSPSQAKKFMAMNISPSDAADENNKNERDEELETCPIPKENIQSWETAGFDRDQACAWKKSGFSRDEAMKWKSNDIDLREALFWKSYKFKASEATKWRESGVSVERAAKLKRLGVPPALAKVFSSGSARIIKRAIGVIRSRCHSIPEENWIPVGGSPYSLKGKCFALQRSSIYQLLGRNRGLMSEGSDGYGPALFYIDSGNRTLDPSLFPAIVKVVGVFKYETTLGSENIIPRVSLVVISAP